MAAVSTSRRVAEEMGIFWKHSTSALSSHEGKGSRNEDSADAEAATGELVGYQIRHDASTVGSRTKIKFMTDGILLKEVTDLLLSDRILACSLPGL